LPRTSQILLDAEEYLLESGNLTISLTGDGPMRKLSTGLVELSNDSAGYTGAITIEQGTLVAGSNSVVRTPQALGQGETEIRDGGTLIHGSAGASGFMQLNADLHLAGGDVGIWRSIAATRWDFEGDWRVSKPSRLLTFDPLGIDELGNVTVNVRGGVTLHDDAGLSVLGGGSVNLLGGVFVDGQSVISTEDSTVVLPAVNAAQGGGSLRLDGGRFSIPAKLNNDPNAGNLVLEIGPTAIAQLTTSASLVIGDGDTLVVNGSLSNTTPVILGGGTLQGVGKLGLVSNVQGEVAPGNSVGVLTTNIFNQSPGGLLTMEVFGGPGLLSDQLRTDVATLSGVLNAITAPGGQLVPGDVFTLVVGRQLTVNNLQLVTDGIAAKLNVVTLQDGPDAGLQALQLTVIPEPAASLLFITALAVFVRHRESAPALRRSRERPYFAKA
jgi:autotransporter-associated beta strand protein